METWQNIVAGIVGLIILYYTFNKKRSVTVQVVVIVALLGAGYYIWFREDPDYPGYKKGPFPGFDRSRLPQSVENPYGA